MNRRILICAASAALMLFTLPALADPSIAPAGITLSGKNADWVDGTNLLEVYGDDYTYHLEDLSGNMLSESGYGSFYYANGYITATRQGAEDVNNEGLMAPDGTVIIDPRYGDIKVKSGRWAIGFTLVPASADNYDYENFFSSDSNDQYFLIETADIYYLTGTGASLTASLPRENYMDANPFGEYLSVENRADGNVTLYDSGWNVVQEGLTSVYSNPDVPYGKYEIFSDEQYHQGISDRSGTVIFEPVFDSISEVNHGYVLFYDEGFYGLADLYGKIIIPAETDYIRANYYAPEAADPDETGSPYPAGNYIAFERDSKLGYYDLDGNLTMPATYASDSLELNGASAVLTNPDGSKVLLAADGKETPLDEAHSSLDALYCGSGFLYTFDGEDYKTGLMDWHGNELLPAQYDSIRLSGDGEYLLVKTDYENSEVYQVTYDEPIPNDTEGLISEDGSAPAPVSVQETEITVQDETGENFVTDEFEDGDFVLDDDTIVSDDEDDSVDFSAVQTLLANALDLADQDMEGNLGAIQALLDSASSLVSSDYPQVSLLIDSASSLISSGAANLGTLKTVINSALSALS